MPHTDLAQQTLVENGMLMLILEGLRNTLAWKVQDMGFARKLSTLRFITQSLQRHLERVLALEEYGGYMDFVVHESPRLTKLVESLKQDHEQLRKDTRQIVQQFENVSPADGGLFAQTCDGLGSLLTRLAAHNKKEATLMQEAFTRDEGGEG
jgi:Hemerythrin HHE cation binding domain